MISHNMTWIKYPSQSHDPAINLEDIIAFNNVISRLMHGYIALFVPVGLLAAIIILAIFIKNYRQHALEKLDILLFAYTISSLLMVLFSFTVTARPDYLEVTYLECGVLSFFSNLSYFSSQYLLILMVLSFFLHRHPPQNAFIKKAHQKPLVCIGFVLTCAFCAALIVVALLGVENYDKGTDCQLDPLFAWPEYEIIKFALGFGLPSLFQLLCFILLLIKEIQPEIRPRQNIHPYLTVLVITITTFTSSLFYNIMILSRSNLKIQRRIGTPQNELTVNIAEILLFSMSCANSVIILSLHKPCRSGLWDIITNFTKVCRRHDSNRPIEMPETHTEVSSVPSENGSRSL